MCSQPKCRPSGLTEPSLHFSPLYLSCARQSLVTAPDSKSLKPERSNNKKKGKPATFLLWTNININAMKNIHVKTTTMIIHLISRYSFFPLITPEKREREKKKKMWMLYNTPTGNQKLIWINSIDFNSKTKIRTSRQNIFLIKEVSFYKGMCTP